MKKSLVAAAALVVTSIAGSASALDVRFAREIVVDGFTGLRASLGAMTFTPLGRAGSYCQYLANWYSPFNPNDVGMCILNELATPFAPSCIVNELYDITTIVEAGAGASGACGPSLCTGFNLKGEVAQATLLLSESVIGLTGVAILDGFGTIQVYPVTVC